MDILLTDLPKEIQIKILRYTRPYLNDILKVKNHIFIGNEQLNAVMTWDIKNICLCGRNKNSIKNNCKLKYNSKYDVEYDRKHNKLINLIIMNDKY